MYCINMKKSFHKSFTSNEIELDACEKNWSVKMTGKKEHPISIKVLEDKRRREHEGKKKGKT